MIDGALVHLQNAIRPGACMQTKRTHSLPIRASRAWVRASLRSPPPLRTIREMMLRCLPLHRTGTNE